MSRSTTRRFYLWIACLALLMNALVPSLSHAMAGTRAASAAGTICRAPGATQPDAMAVEAAASLMKQALPADTTPMQDCAYCPPHAGSDGLLPESSGALGLFGTHNVRPFLFYRAPRPLLALAAAAPRGPPAPVLA